MNLSHIHEKLTSFAVSAMLTSAFLTAPPSGISAASAGPQPQAVMNMLGAVHASGWAGTQEMTPPAASAPQSASATAQDRILSTAQKKALAELLAAYGHDCPLKPDITGALGLSKGDEAITLRQLSKNDHPLIHTYIPLADGGILLIFTNPGAGAWSYRIDANLTLVAAVVKNKGQALVVVPMSDAERNIQTELEYWAALADRYAGAGR